MDASRSSGDRVPVDGPGRVSLTAGGDVHTHHAAGPWNRTTIAVGPTQSLAALGPACSG